MIENMEKNEVNRTTEAQLVNHHKWLPYQFLGIKTVITVQIDPQIMLIWSKDLNVTLSVSEGVSDTLVREKLSF